MSADRRVLIEVGILLFYNLVSKNHTYLGVMWKSNLEKAQKSTKKHTWVPGAWHDAVKTWKWKERAFL